MFYVRKDNPLPDNHEILSLLSGGWGGGGGGGVEGVVDDR